MVSYDELSRIIECLLFVAGEPLTAKELAKTTETEEDAVYEALRLVRDRFVLSGLQVVEIAGGWQLATRPEYAAAIGKLLAPRANRLSKPALETAAIIAYRQPCTQAEVEAIRGVAVDGVLKTLSERELITEAGRKQAPGRPILYATTEGFCTTLDCPAWTTCRLWKKTARTRKPSPKWRIRPLLRRERHKR